MKKKIISQVIHLNLILYCGGREKGRRPFQIQGYGAHAESHEGSRHLSTSTTQHLYQIKKFIKKFLLSMCRLTLKSARAEKVKRERTFTELFGDM